MACPPAPHPRKGFVMRDVISRYERECIRRRGPKRGVPTRFYIRNIFIKKRAAIRDIILGDIKGSVAFAHRPEENPSFVSKFVLMIGFLSIFL